MTPLPTTSTAAAAAAVAAGEYDAAVCAPIAAERYGLERLVEDIADHAGAVTRFVLVAPPGALPEPTGNDKTSLVAVVGDRTGALLELLSEFAVRGISLTRIESRPTRQRLGVYSFSLDCEGHVAEARVGEALAALHRVCDDVRFLGSYARADGRDNKPVPETAADAAVRRGGDLAGGTCARPHVIDRRILPGSRGGMPARRQADDDQLRLRRARVRARARRSSDPSPACWATRPCRR